MLVIILTGCIRFTDESEIIKQCEISFNETPISATEIEALGGGGFIICKYPDRSEKITVLSPIKITIGED